MLDAHPFSRRFWRRPLDARPIALFRIALGLLTLLDLGERLSNFYAFYTWGGVVPASWVAWRGWLFGVSRSPSWAMAVFALGFLSAAALTLGLWPRLAAFVTWLVMRSIMVRAYTISDGGDLVLIQLLLWSCFVDLGARASLAVRLGLRPAASHVAAFPVRMLQLQVAMVYGMTGVLKLVGDWLEGDAVYFSLGSVFARDSGLWLHASPWLCLVVTVWTLWFELLFPLLVFAPLRRLRALTLLHGVAFHAGIAITMRVGIFSEIMVVGYLPFLCAAVTGQRWLDRVLAPLPVMRLAAARPWRRRLAQGVYAVTIASALWSVTGSTPAMQRFSAFLGTQQPWTMFAPGPPGFSNYFTGWGERTDGERIDVVREEIPALGPARRWYSRWLKYREVLGLLPDDRVRKLGEFLCRRYNHAHAVKLVRFRLTMHVSVTPPPHGPPEDAIASVVLRQECLK